MYLMCSLWNLHSLYFVIRSRSIQIGMNLAVLEEWIEQTGLPPGVRMHFRPVRDLLHWLQVLLLFLCEESMLTSIIHQSLSSISEFPDLVATIQALRHINPLQVGFRCISQCSKCHNLLRCDVLSVTTSTRSMREK